MCSFLKIKVAELVYRSLIINVILSSHFVLINLEVVDNSLLDETLC